MPRNATIVSFSVSSDELDLLNQLSGTNRSAWLRCLILDEAKRRGLTTPENTLKDTRATHGGLHKSNES